MGRENYQPGNIRHRRALKNLPEDKRPDSIPEADRLTVNTGGAIPCDAMDRLWIDSFKSRRDLKQYKFARMPVCSHFAAMMIYLARDPQCTLQVVSSADFDYIFKMTPSHLLHQAYRELHMCEGAQVIGMQHKGQMIVETDLGELIDRSEEFARLLGFQPTGAEPHQFPETGVRKRLGIPDPPPLPKL